MVDRSQTARALAKCIAFYNVGQMEKSRWWFGELARILGFGDMLR